MSDPSAGPSSSAPISIVLADDDDRFRTLVRSVLEDDGHVVLAEARDAHEAKELTSVHRPDVLVLDLVMPGADGVSAVREILEENPGQAVLVISSLFDPLVEQDVVALGAMYLEKAEGVDALEHAIATAAVSRGGP